MTRNSSRRTPAGPAGAPKLSVALASYNGARFIEAQLSSIAKQTRLPEELVVCDDRSVDGTPEIVERFATRAPFAVRLHRNPENLGFNGNFERVLALCSGDIIFISDQDDIWYPHKIERVVARLMASENTLAVINDEDIGDTEGRPVGVTFLENVRKLGLSADYHVAGCCTALRRELLDLLLPFPGHLNYDQWTARLLGLLRVKETLEEPLQLYRRHGLNSTETLPARRSVSMIDLVRSYGLADARAGWRAEMSGLEVLRRRLLERRARAEALARPDRVAAALSRITVERDRLRRRLAVLEKTRLRRARAVLELWRSGFYKDFSGAKSAIKDLIRR